MLVIFIVVHAPYISSTYPVSTDDCRSTGHRVAAEELYFGDPALLRSLKYIPYSRMQSGERTKCYSDD